VVDELIVSFTHDREMRVFLPGVTPTGRKVVLPHVVVMGFDQFGRVAYEHIYWDQALDYSIRHGFPCQARNKPGDC
jgi:carboxymethylenebutenolidase